jgi:PAS domain S-box-containing protein
MAGPGWLFDTTGFRPRAECGDWSAGLMWLHIGSDLFIWLAYVSIPLVLIFFVRRRSDLPYPRLFVLFALFILFCGLTHFIEALIFYRPVYRLSGVVKFATAVVSWLTVAALVPVVPKALAMAATAGGVKPDTGTAAHRPLTGAPAVPSGRTRDYIVALLAGVLAVLVRAALDPFLESDHVFVLSLLAVAFVAWRSGFWPAMVTLMVSMLGIVYFFVPRRYTLQVEGLGNQLAVALFFFCGVVCAAIGESQRQAAVRAKAALAQLDAFLMNAPVGIAFYDAGLRYVRVNPVLAAANHRPVEAHAGKTTREVAPEFPTELLLDIEHGLTAAGPLARTLTAPIGPDGEAVTWQVTVFPVRDAAGEGLGVGVIGQDVTEQKRVERELRAGEARFRAFMNASPGSKYVKDSAGRYLVVNPAFERVFGKPAAEVVGRTDAELFPAALAGHFAALDRRGREAGRTVEFEDTFEFAGRAHTVLAARFPLPDGAVGGIGTDITARKRAEAALKESEERYRALAEAVPPVVWVTRPDGRVEYLNPRWEEYTGDPVEAAMGDGWAAYLHPDDRERTAAAWEAAVRTGERYDTQYRLRRRDGGYEWFLARGVPQKDAAGRVVRWFGTCANIHATRQLADDLRQSLDRFRSLTEAIPQMVWTTDPAGRVTFFNRRWQEYTGLAPDAEPTEEAGWAAVAHPDDAGRVASGWQLARLQGADHFAQEFRVRRVSDGAYRWMLSYAVPLRDEAGGVTEWVGTLTDIDDQKRAAERLEQMVRERTAELERANSALRDEVEERRRAEELVRATARELTRSNEELEKFAYVASHDLQEPLRKIQAFGDRVRLKFRENLPDQGRDYVDRMLTSATRMRRLIDDLLTFSRVTTQARPFAPVDLAEVAGEVVGDLEPRLEQTGGTIDVGPLPTIDADPSQMRQLFQNLLTNALKFHKPGVPPVVTVRGEPAPGPGANGDPAPLTCVLTVRDNGIGFDEKYRDRIFEVFQRLHGRTEYEGTGVGLAICRKIVERHGGTITAHSREHEGATFVVTLPVRQPREEPVADGHRPDQADHHPDGR